MKKLMIAAAIVCAAVCANAAKVGWSSAGMSAFSGDAYALFVIGQNGVTSIAQVEKAIKGGDFADYVFGQGAVNTSGYGNVAASNSGKILDAGTYTSFMVLFNDTDMEEATKFVTLSGASGQTKTIAATTASTTFIAGDVGSIVNDSTKWQSASVPEPTSAMLLLLGVAGLALKRKQK